MIFLMLQLYEYVSYLIITGECVSYFVITGQYVSYFVTTGICTGNGNSARWIKIITLYSSLLWCFRCVQVWYFPCYPSGEKRISFCFVYGRIVGVWLHVSGFVYEIVLLTVYF
ncbi:hypothetical protein Tcan_01132, partial [Toxocara canis]